MSSLFLVHQTAFYSFKQSLNYTDSTVGYHRMQKYFYAAFLQEMTRCRHLSRQEVKQTMDVDMSGCHCLRRQLFVGFIAIVSA